MKFTVPELPFTRNALEPYMSEETLRFHHGKHHAAYVKKLNELILGTAFEDLSLVEILNVANGPILDNAGQHWNHSFFWQSLSPNHENQSGDFFSALDQNFESFENFMAIFKNKAMSFFGSGWICLVKQENALSIVTTRNGETPISQKQTPLLICDLWEHAYYIDWRNERARYIDNFFLIANWKFAADNLRDSIKQNIAA